eukprot:TRINITY_DN5473_c0_g1_i4.p1 TRINITY_DN5473_c0_g1~~TRINITY_DN5473_c0_g1_i4.p1  ORF type:complete len:724 (+),score=133.76 TRINITY_DN5473_c0_g1_i4:149-2320(+)
MNVSQETVIKKGYLYKLGRLFRTWKKRFFVLRGNKLYYHIDERSHSERGVIELIDCVVSPVVRSDVKKAKEGPFCFDITCVFANASNRTTYHLSTSSEQDMMEWLHAIRECVIVKVSAWVVKSLNTKPTILGTLVVSLKNGLQLPSNRMYNIIITLDNQIARQQKLIPGISGTPTPVWDQTIAFAVWSLESRLLLRLAVCKRHTSRTNRDNQSKIVAINSSNLSQVYDRECTITKTVELYLLNQLGSSPHSTPNGQDGHYNQIFTSTSLHHNNPKLQLSVQFYSIDTSVAFLLENYNQLITSISNNPAILILICNHAIHKKDDSVISALMNVLLHQRKALSLLSWLIKEEVNRCIDPNTLFRTDNLVTKLMSSFSRQVGCQYRRKLLENILLGICRQPQGYELDPNRLTSSDSLESNTNRVFKKVDEITRVITSQIDTIPQGFSIVCKILSREITTKFSSGCINKALSGFIFLRFLCPAIVSPLLLYEDDPLQVPDVIADLNMEKRRPFIIIGKVIQSLANEVGFGIKEKYLEVLAPHIECLRDPIQRFYESLSHTEDHRNHLHTTMRHGFDDVHQDENDVTTQSLDIEIDIEPHSQQSGQKRLAADVVRIHRFLVNHPIPPDVDLTYAISEVLQLSMEQVKVTGLRSLEDVMGRLELTDLKKAIMLSESNGAMSYSLSNQQQSQSGMHTSPTMERPQTHVLVTVMRALNPNDPLYLLPRLKS